MRNEIKQEFELRMQLWQQLVDEYGSLPQEVPPSLLNNLKIFYGGRGVWRDATRTKLLSEDINGIVVGVLHTGIHYEDDLTDTEIMYHYPVTKRESTDQNEIESLKNSKRYDLPLFVISKDSPNSTVRNVHLGWVEDWDDDLLQFLITFEKHRASSSGNKIERDSVFKLKDDSGSRTTTTTSAKRDKSFKFKVFKRYKVNGKVSCALTGLSIDGLTLDAAHLHPKSENGTDDPRNGLPLAPTIHRALDSGVIAICPNDYLIHGESSVIKSLGICYKDLNHLSNLPERLALEYLWGKYLKTKTH